MFTLPTARWAVWCAILAAALAVSQVPQASAYPGYFSARCGSCHTNDTESCVACHKHRGSLVATTDKADYAPGETVVVTLAGGGRGGWTRGLLYSQSNAELDRASGPTGTGDDGTLPKVIFPVRLSAPAPTQAGSYTWQAAWFGNTQNTGSTHGEVRTSITVVVRPPVSGVDEGPATWAAVKALFRP